MVGRLVLWDLATLWTLSSPLLQMENAHGNVVRVSVGAVRQMGTLVFRTFSDAV